MDQRNSLAWEELLAEQIRQPPVEGQIQIQVEEGPSLVDRRRVAVDMVAVQTLLLVAREEGEEDRREVSPAAVSPVREDVVRTSSEDVFHQRVLLLQPLLLLYSEPWCL